jgi:hypothetical protein
MRYDMAIKGERGQTGRQSYYNIELSFDLLQKNAYFGLALSYVPAVKLTDRSLTDLSHFDSEKPVERHDVISGLIISD